MDVLTFNIGNPGDVNITQGKVTLLITATVGNLKYVISRNYTVDPSLLVVMDSYGHRYNDKTPVMEVLQHCEQRIPFVAQIPNFFNLKFDLKLIGQPLRREEIELSLKFELRQFREHLERSYPGSLFEIKFPSDNPDHPGLILSDFDVLSSVTESGKYRLFVEEFQERDPSQTKLYKDLLVLGTMKGAIGYLDFPTDATVSEVINIARKKYNKKPARITLDGVTLNPNLILSEQLVKGRVNGRDRIHLIELVR